jgi:hypothetical protein
MQAKEKAVIQVKVSETVRSINIIPVSDESLSLNFLKKHIGLSDGKSYIEIISKQILPGMNIVIVCDEEGKLNGLLPNLILPNRDFVVGDVLLCSREFNQEGEPDLFGMDAETVFSCLTPLSILMSGTIHNN